MKRELRRRRSEEGEVERIEEKEKRVEERER